MLREIYCEQFYQKHIRFNDSLSVVLGTDTGDNSIGKSTFLLIVDYAFGGTTYSKATDIISNIGPHDIFFSFEFDKGFFHFCRNNIDSQTVWECDENYKKLNPMTSSEYCNWLRAKYDIELSDLSFRDAIGRYIRVYGKNNCDEKHPLHYTATEKSEKASMALLRLFNLYLPLKDADQQLQNSESALSAYKKAQSLKFISRITKAKFQKNEKDIAELSAQIEKLSIGLEKGLADVDAEASEQAIYIKNQLSKARRLRNKLKSRYTLLQENGNYKFSETGVSLSELARFFPNVNLAKIKEIESFHQKISTIFKAELLAERRSIEKEMSEYDNIIKQYEANLQELIHTPNLSKIVLEKHAMLLKQIEQMQNENLAYTQLQTLKVVRDDDKERYQKIQVEQFAILSYQMNEEMSKINDIIYSGSYNAPILEFTDTGYHFFTPDDTGTGIAYKGLVVYDLAVLGLTNLPLLVHDSVILKQISDDAIEQIITLYSAAGKQIIIALDKQTSYSETTNQLLADNAVLTLAPNGKELFGKSWG